MFICNFSKIIEKQMRERSMNIIIKIALLVMSTFSLKMLLTVDIDNSNRAPGNSLSSIHECDRNNDGVVDAVYHCTYDISGNEIIVALDSNNDGLINQVCCFSLN